jgi:hypothetical protein
MRAKQDLTVRNEGFSKNRKGKREYLNDSKTRTLLKDLNQYLQSKVRIARIRIGDEQEIETLLSGETSLFARYLRKEKKDWLPRIGIIEKAQASSSIANPTTRFLEKPN